MAEEQPFEDDVIPVEDGFQQNEAQLEPIKEVVQPVKEVVQPVREVAQPIGKEILPIAAKGGKKFVAAGRVESNNQNLRVVRKLTKTKRVVRTKQVTESLEKDITSKRQSGSLSSSARNTSGKAQ